MDKFIQKVSKWASEVWDKFTTVAAKFIAWCVANKELAFVIFSSLVTAWKYTVKVIKLKKEEEWRNRRFYDRRTDRWCYAKKKLNRRQENIIEERYRDGETYREILDSMGLLK